MGLKNSFQCWVEPHAEKNIQHISFELRNLLQRARELFDGLGNVDAHAIDASRQYLLNLSRRGVGVRDFDSLYQILVEEIQVSMDPAVTEGFEGGASTGLDVVSPQPTGSVHKSGTEALDSLILQLIQLEEVGVDPELYVGLDAEVHILVDANFTAVEVLDHRVHDVGIHTVEGDLPLGRLIYVVPSEGSLSAGL